MCVNLDFGRDRTSQNSQMPIGMISGCCYLAKMRHVLRRLFILILSLSVVTGVSVQYAAAAAMGAKSTSMALVMTAEPMSGDCSGCPAGDGKMSVGACVAYCSMVVAILPPMASPSMSSKGWMPVARMKAGAGKTVPPDPYPPRPTILS